VYIALTLPFNLLNQTDLLGELEQNLQCVACTKELTPTKQRYLVSFGERMSTTIFSAYLNKLGKRTRQVLDTSSGVFC
jgi:aspartokinase